MYGCLAKVCRYKIALVGLIALRAVLSAFGLRFARLCLQGGVAAVCRIAGFSLTDTKSTGARRLPKTAICQRCVCPRLARSPKPTTLPIAVLIGAVRSRRYMARRLRGMAESGSGRRSGRTRMAHGLFKMRTKRAV